MKLTDVADLRSPGIGALDALRVGDHVHHDLPDLVRLGEDRDRVSRTLAHLSLAVGAEHDGRFGVDRLRLREYRSIATVKRPHDLARQLQVRSLVLADRHVGRLVDDDVSGLQHGVVEQPHAVLDALLALLLVGGRALDPADRDNRVEDPCQLRVLGEVGLADQGASFRVEAHGQQVEHHVVGEAPHLLAVVDRGQGVHVDDAVDRVVLVLQLDVVDLRSQVVAQVRRPRRLDPAEHTFAYRSRRCRLPAGLGDGGGHRRPSVARCARPGPRCLKDSMTRSELGRCRGVESADHSHGSAHGERH